MAPTSGYIKVLVLWKSHILIHVRIQWKCCNHEIRKTMESAGTGRNVFLTCGTHHYSLQMCFQPYETHFPHVGHVCKARKCVSGCMKCVSYMWNVYVCTKMCFQAIPHPFLHFHTETRIVWPLFWCFLQLSLTTSLELFSWGASRVCPLLAHCDPSSLEIPSCSLTCDTGTTFSFNLKWKCIKFLWGGTNHLVMVQSKVLLLAALHFTCYLKVKYDALVFKSFLYGMDLFCGANVWSPALCLNHVDCEKCTLVWYRRKWRGNNNSHATWNMGSKGLCWSTNIG